MTDDLRITNDPDADAIYIHLRPIPLTGSHPLDEARCIDLGPDGQPVGVELLNVSQGVDVQGLPEAERIAKELRRRGITVSGESEAAQLEWNRQRLLTEIRARLATYEARYELPSARLEEELEAGRIRETAEVCAWLIDWHTYQALVQEGDG